MLAFRSLDAFRALREPDRRRRDEERPFPLRTKNWQQNPKQPLDRKSPIQVRCELDPHGFGDLPHHFRYWPAARWASTPCSDGPALPECTRSKAAPQRTASGSRRKEDERAHLD